jgi:hypothetical protein
MSMSVYLLLRAEKLRRGARDSYRLNGQIIAPDVERIAELESKAGRLADAARRARG